MTEFATTSDADGVPNTRSADRSIFIGLLLVYVFVSIIAAFFELLDEMSFDACGERGPASVCDYAVANALPFIEWGGIALITVAMVAVAAIRARRRLRIWWLPVVAGGLVVALTAGISLEISHMINYYPWQPSQWPR